MAMTPRKRINALLTRIPGARSLSALRKRRKKDRALRDALRELAKFPKHRHAPRHRLPDQLVVSLTSYPARFSTLHLTLQSILDQRVKPDAVVLWIADADDSLLPAAVTDLEGAVLTVRRCEDIRNFKKIVPTLTAFPGAFIAICDDDTYYPDDWLERLVASYDERNPSIVCFRAHRVAFGPDGHFLPYSRWDRSVRDARSLGLSTDLLATGNRGVLYPHGSLPCETTDMDLARRLSETCDDSWLFFMGRRAGWSIKRAPGKPPRFIEWPGTQTECLASFHRRGKKDEHLRDMIAHFGRP
jgi:hypothetical protein